jgi:adenosylcobinamide-phosphate synthase
LTLPGISYHEQDGIVLLAAYLLDRAFGDPFRFPHPVRGIGWLIRKSEELLRRFTKNPGSEKTAGAVLVVLVVLPVFGAAWFLLFTANRLSPGLGLAVSVLIAYTTLAARGLADAAGEVRFALDGGDLERAKAGLGMIVGRDTADLDEQGIVRAVVETVAENASDGVIAPLFFLALGGPALALAYKAVNTLDSMVGYKNERYRHFGWAAARLDDAVNYIPARLTAFLICLAHGVSPRRGARTGFRAPWRIMLRDGRRHPSPNSGYPEAAMAGALGVGLGGPISYGGAPGGKPEIGDSLRRLHKKDIDEAVGLMYSASLFALAGAAAFRMLA